MERDIFSSFGPGDSRQCDGVAGWDMCDTNHMCQNFAPSSLSQWRRDMFTAFGPRDGVVRWDTCDTCTNVVLIVPFATLPSERWLTVAKGTAVVGGTCDDVRQTLYAKRRFTSLDDQPNVATFPVELILQY